MKTKFHFLKPWLSWSKKKYDGYTVIYRGFGLNTGFDYMNHETEWSFEITILGFGFMIERYPVLSKVVKEATKALAKEVRERKRKKE